MLRHSIERRFANITLTPTGQASDNSLLLSTKGYPHSSSTSFLNNNLDKKARCRDQNLEEAGDEVKHEYAFFEPSWGKWELLWKMFDPIFCVIIAQVFGLAYID
ncbi:unnamed protein product [Acanthoscelides obtectus]|uniref:Uncharacterized protein n=1 Tax=Acanthoscelides obtectus TaxID=200917 RepID=A0A9P0KZR3_ACAOB|nr:unnamed protein product [Acanthoscelides obtectus]CAK1645698.1 hypothetical protein AOBTE_LOCUS14216 [Acanthoscelides obtectus]